MPHRPLRIAYVLSYFHPFESGAERQALAQGAELVRRGHQVRVITQMPVGADLPIEEWIQGVRVERVVRPVRRGPLFGLSFVAGVAMALRHRRHELDLVHTHQALWEAISCGFARGWLVPLPTLIQPASSGYYGEADELLRTKGHALLRRLILRNTLFVAISAEIENQWRALGVPDAKLLRLASGVDTSCFHPGPSRVEALMPPGPRVVFTGRIHPQKNLDVLFQAWPEVLRQVSAHLVLVGDGPERTRLEQLARNLGIASHVVFTGTVADPSEHLRAANVFVLPSHCEGMSNSLLEAMATGLPCVASEVGGNTDLIQPGETGLLVPSVDVEGWARALTRVLTQPKLAHSLGTSALHRIEREFALTRVVDRYLEIYNRLLHEPTPSDHAGNSSHQIQSSI